jgi:hypothetical protein
MSQKLPELPALPGAVQPADFGPGANRDDRAASQKTAASATHARLVMGLEFKCTASSEPEEQIAALRVAEFLERNYLHVLQNEKVVFGMQLIEATAGACRLRVVVPASRGWHRDLISIGADGVPVGAVSGLAPLTRPEQVAFAPTLSFWCELQG